MIRILFILENYYPNIGGVETLFKTLAECLVERGFKVQVLTNRFNPSLSPRETINGVDVIRLKLGNRYLFSFFAGFSAVAFARKNDIIHTTSYNAALPAFFAYLFTGKKPLITFHEVWGKLWFELPYMNKAAQLLHYLFEQFILRLPFKRFIAVSDYTRNCLINAGIPEDKVVCIHNGIDYNEFKIDRKPHAQAKFSFCFFGRLGISKGLNLLLKAVKITKDINPDFNLVLILPRHPKAFLARIKNEISAYGIGSHITLKHELSFEQLKTAVGNSDAVIIPSYSEGFCYSAVETMALGVPIISSGKGALSEVIGGQLLVMREHTADALSDCMLKAMNGKWESQPEKIFQLEESIQDYISLYRKLI